MSIIVYAIDAQSKTINFFKNDIDALGYQNKLRNDGWEVAYIDLPNVDYRDARQIYEAVEQ